jgi:Transposase DDE domain
MDWKDIQFFREDRAMLAEDLLAEYAKKAPVPVMLRGILENVLAPQRLNSIFESEAEKQYTRELTFAMVVDLMCRVVTRVQPSPRAAYQERAADFPVGERAVYDKINGVEPRVSAALVRGTARELEVVLRTLGQVAEPAVPGYRLKIVDGNHFSATDRRLRLLRGGGPPLPGQALAVLDPAVGLVIDLFPCEDGHAQERSLLPEVLKTVQAGDLWLEDRNFCTTGFLFGIDAKDAAFLVRQHANALHWELVAERRYLGRTERGQVYEQAIILWNEQGQELRARRLTLALDQPTRDGETELHLLTNLPHEAADGLLLARLYLMRWLIETAFAELTVPLVCEVKSLGSPPAAIFTFATAVVCYNAIQVLKAAIAAVHEPAPNPASALKPVPPAAGPAQRSLRDDLSTYYIANEVSTLWRGIDLMTPQSLWDDQFGKLAPPALADRLRVLAANVNVRNLRKRPPSQRPSKRTSPSKPGSHVSTAKILAGVPPKPK